MFISSSLKCPPSLVVLVFWDPTTIITPPRWYWCWRKDNLRTRNIFNALNSFSRFDIIIRGVIYGTSMDQTQHILLANILASLLHRHKYRKEAIWFIIHTNNQEKIFVNGKQQIHFLQFWKQNDWDRQLFYNSYQLSHYIWLLEFLKCPIQYFQKPVFNFDLVNFDTLKRRLNCLKM